MSGTVKVIVYRVGQAPVIEEIPNTLESMQGLVGGYIEYVPLSDTFCLICNEEGKLVDLPPNRLAINIDVICGDFFVSRDASNGELQSVEDADLAAVSQFFSDC